MEKQHIGVNLKIFFGRTCIAKKKDFDTITDTLTNE